MPFDFRRAGYLRKMGTCGSSQTTATQPQSQASKNDAPGEKAKAKAAEASSSTAGGGTTHMTTTTTTTVSNKRVVCVLGCSDTIGGATVRALSTQYGDQVEIRAGVGVGNEKAADGLRDLAGVSVVTATMGDCDGLTSTFEGVDTIFVTVPPTNDRCDVTVRTLQAGKAAGVKHVVIVGTPSGSGDETVIEQQFEEIDNWTRSIGLPYTVLRLPTLIDTRGGFTDGIVHQSKIYCSVDPQKPYCPVVIDDVAKAAATVLSASEKHANKTYTLLGNRHSYGEVAQVFTDVLGRPIDFVHMPYNGGKQAFLNMGFPDWQAEAATNFMQMMYSTAPQFEVPNINMGDYQLITGDAPTDLKTWVYNYKDNFMQVHSTVVTN